MTLKMKRSSTSYKRYNYFVILYLQPRSHKQYQNYKSRNSLLFRLPIQFHSIVSGIFFILDILFAMFVTYVVGRKKMNVTVKKVNF